MSHRAHGTLVRYVIDRCRCTPCRTANRAYENNRTRQIAYGRWQPYIDAEDARTHTRMLMEFGVGWQRLARLAGVSNGGMAKLLYGGPGTRPPSRRIRPATAERILALHPSPGLLGDGVTVDPTGTRRRLQALVATGWSQSKLANRLGMNRANFGKMLASSTVTTGTARRARELYDELWNQAPPQDHHRDKGAASRARTYAAARRWAPPLAWDDDSIDDPTAAPDWGAKTSRDLALLENSDELIRQGYTLQQAAERLEVSRDYLSKARGRAVARPEAVAS
ncbi:hypothetical protein [Streptosporangium sp. NPDC002721]|uniref:hypothetical protein n=1 Tax=Streptosporangium sp. NPDC002721 TaxID=3366188 RepID=UPI0036C342CB